MMSDLIRRLCARVWKVPPKSFERKVDLIISKGSSTCTYLYLPVPHILTMTISLTPTCLSAAGSEDQVAISVSDVSM